jgi:OmpA-OmpF porin, OOP family
VIRKLAFLLVFAPALAAAQGQEFPPRKEPPLVGAYVGALVGSSEAKNGCVGVLAGGGRICDKTDLAWGVFAGYRFSRHFGVELGYTELGKVEARTQGPGTSSTQSTSVSVVDGTVVGIIPLIGEGGVGLSAFAKLGIYEATLETTAPGINDASNWKLTYSGGLQWDATPRWGLRASWQRYKGVGHGAFGNTDYDVMAVSGLWRF